MGPQGSDRLRCVPAGARVTFRVPGGAGTMCAASPERASAARLPGRCGRALGRAPFPRRGVYDAKPSSCPIPRAAPATSGADKRAGHGLGPFVRPEAVRTISRRRRRPASSMSLRRAHADEYTGRGPVPHGSSRRRESMPLTGGPNWSSRTCSKPAAPTGGQLLEYGARRPRPRAGRVPAAAAAESSRPTTPPALPHRSEIRPYPSSSPCRPRGS